MHLIMLPQLQISKFKTLILNLAILLYMELKIYSLQSVT